MPIYSLKLPIHAPKDERGAADPTRDTRARQQHHTPSARVHLLPSRWRVGDLAIWDNRCAIHYAVDDCDGARRLMHRTTIKDEQPLSARGSA
jgi:alpha-ketoglutarate-dependent taurine dioxygenase